MNSPQTKLKSTAEMGNSAQLQKLHLERLNPMMLMAGGAILLVILAVMLFAGGTSQKDNEQILERAQESMSQVGGVVQSFRRVLEDQQVQELAVIATTNPDKLSNLQQYVSGRLPGLVGIELFGNKPDRLRASELGKFGYAVLDMLMTSAEAGLAPAQIHGKGENAYLAMAVSVGAVDSPSGYLLVMVKTDNIISAFRSSLPDAGVFALDQFNGRARPYELSGLASPPTDSERVFWIRIPDSLLRVGVIQAIRATNSAGVLTILTFIFGLVSLSLGVMLELRPYKPPPELEESLEEDLPPPDSGDSAESQTFQMKSMPSGTVEGEKHTGSGDDNGDGFGPIALPDLGFSLEKAGREKADLEKAGKTRRQVLPPVELQQSIFRAYDIRGIIGETLDADIAHQIGQVVGSLTLEQYAGPVIVARDGRSSGEYLLKGLIEGITSTGCDVVDIGGVPTGVLYFAAYELGNETGVMVTGSHNPPNYNGFKILIGGVTQAGDQITDMYKRIKEGNLRVGKGTARRENMLGRFREKISDDIQLQRPLKIVADCGNGIAGVNAADVLRDIGAEVVPLFDEVDGTFPNHHPDPSDPENLEDLIKSVKAMGADLGIAFDGDADRLGVVTPSGEVIFSDRLMMLFARDVLEREPGATIIYDVKCSGHLHHAIQKAGGKAMMYKTGHSLIKNKMKEVGAPLAGEMSGHFFFKERWYGFDCGIYSAARLLEILAADERTPEEVLSSLPNSVNTPELKVEMKEGENHTFIAEMQEKAKFADSKSTTIDGLRVDFVDGWGLVRASNTTPILVLRFEADSKQSLQRIKALFSQQMLAINDQLKLPF